MGDGRISTQYNLGLETIKLHEEYFKRQEKKIHEALDTLEGYNDLLREFSKLTATLNTGKKNGKLDFTDHELRITIDKLFALHPELFYGFEQDLYANWDKERIERVVAGADPIIRNYTAQVSQGTMKVQVLYNDQTEITRNLQRVIEEQSKHIQSILAKLKGVG
jgi:hypothetical protein